VNQNYEYYPKIGFYHSFEELIAYNNSENFDKQIYKLSYWYVDSTTQKKSYGDLKFLENNVLELTLRDENRTSIEGTYSFNTIANQEILKIDFPSEVHEDNISKGYLLDIENNNTIKEITLQNETIIDTGYRLLQYSQKNSYSSLDEFIIAHQKEQNRPLDLSGTEYILLRGYFTDNNQIELYEINGTKSNLHINYERRIVGNTEILIIKPPVEITSYNKNSQTIYSVQNGKVRRGFYIIAPSDDMSIQYPQYNRTAIMDIIDAVERKNSTTGAN
jgi:hypothetical protein